VARVDTQTRWTDEQSSHFDFLGERDLTFDGAAFWIIENADRISRPVYLVDAMRKVHPAFIARESATPPRPKISPSDRRAQAFAAFASFSIREAANCLRMRKALFNLRVVGLIGLLILALAANSRHSRNVAALAAYKAELRAKGEKLTFHELGFPRPPESLSNLNLLVGGLQQLEHLPTTTIEPGSADYLRSAGPGASHLGLARVALEWEQDLLLGSFLGTA